jgi:RNA polymerase sigma factor (sigma-70 family)
VIDVEAALSHYGVMLRAEVNRTMRTRPVGIDASDLEQVARLAIVDAISKFNGRGRVDPFVCQRVRWALVDEVRRASLMSRQHWSKVKAAGGRQMVVVSVDVAAPQMAVAAVVVDGIGQRRMRRAIRALPSRLRSVIVQRYYRGQTLADVGHQLGVSAPSVFALQVKAEQQLRAAMQVQ